jgi:four helix bundle protein
MKYEKGNELQERLIEFAVRILSLADKLPSTPAGKHIRGQIIKSGTSPAPNYSESRGAESNADFIHKLKVVIKELNETLVWLEIIVRSKMLKLNLLENLIDENEQLCKIISSSIATTQKKNTKISK